MTHGAAWELNLFMLDNSKSNYHKSLIIPFQMVVVIVKSNKKNEVPQLQHLIDMVIIASFPITLS